jgi:hypothetical protein
MSEPCAAEAKVDKVYAYDDIYQQIISEWLIRKAKGQFGLRNSIAIRSIPFTLLLSMNASVHVASRLSTDTIRASSHVEGFHNERRIRLACGTNRGLG